MKHYHLKRRAQKVPPVRLELIAVYMRHLKNETRDSLVLNWYINEGQLVSKWIQVKEQ